MKKIVVVLISFVFVIILFNLFCQFYNHVLTPFKGENKEILYTPEDYSLWCEEEVVKFYHDFLEYENYEKEYDTNYYYCFGRKSLFPIITVTCNTYANESYSYVVKCDDDYNQIKEKILNEYQFANIPIMVSYDTNERCYESFIEINGTIYQELHYEYFIGDNKLAYYNPEIFRTDSYWFGYNDERKELIFSFLFKDTSMTDIEKDDLVKLISNSLYT